MDRFAVLMVEEAANTAVQQAAYVKATSRDTVRSRSFTGKPARMLRNDWTEAWEQPESPKPLGMPLQYMVSGMAVKATHKYPNETVDVAFNRWGRLLGSSPRWKRRLPLSNAGCRSTSRRPPGWTHSMLPRPFDNGRQARAD